MAYHPYRTEIELKPSQFSQQGLLRQLLAHIGGCAFSVCCLA